MNFAEGIIFQLKDDTSLAGVAQLVERQLPKLNVASSNLVSRSRFLKVSSLIHLQDGSFKNLNATALPSSQEGRKTETGVCSSRRRFENRSRVGSCSSVVEHSLGKGEVDGSIPSTSSNLKLKVEP